MPPKRILLRMKRKGKRKADDQGDDAVTQWDPWEKAHDAVVHYNTLGADLTSDGISHLCNGSKKITASGSFKDPSGISPLLKSTHPHPDCRHLICIFLGDGEQAKFGNSRHDLTVLRSGFGRATRQTGGRRNRQ